MTAASLTKTTTKNGFYLESVCLCLLLAVLVEGISDKTLRVIGEKEEIVSSITERAAELFEQRAIHVSNCECSLHSCAYEFPGAECHDRLGGLSGLCGEDCEGQLLDYNQTIIRMPPGTDPQDMSASLKESICTYRGLDSLFFDLFPRAFAWTYVGTTDGHFRRWPAAGRTHDERGDPLLDGCRSYDPRTRPWYIAASTGPKDIIFVIDKSGSMLDPQRGGTLKWNTTTDAVLAVIDTLGTTDYFNIVAFSDEAEQLWTQSNLAQGTTANKEAVQNLLKNQIPSGGTNFDAAFKLAFSLMTNACSVERKTCSRCEKVIIFLTDGKDTSRSLDGGIRPSEMAVRIAGYQDELEEATSRRASIFTFSMGQDADDSIPRQIACNNDGSWSYISDTDDPLTAMRSYYLFLTARRTSGSPIWAEPYVDDSGLGLITTVARPVFSMGTENLTGVFLGVAGHDVLFSELGDTDSEQDTILNELVERGSRCDPFITDRCQLQVLRNAFANQATCIDRFPIRTVPSSDVDEPQCFTNGRSFYKRFSSLVSWDKAADHCREDGGALASVGSDEELAFVANMASDDGSWIGARREFDTFTWLDRTSADLDFNSVYWGIGQPDSFSGREECVSIDTRGPTGNLNDARCENQLTFICEYETDDTCKGQIMNPRDDRKQYFSVPPVDLCVNAEASLARADTIASAENLKEEDVMCTLGRPRHDSEFRCCSDCLDSINTPGRTSPDPEPRKPRGQSATNSGASGDSGISGSVVIAIAIVACVVVVGAMVGFLAMQRCRTGKTVKDDKKEEHPQSPQQHTPPSTTVPSATTRTSDGQSLSESQV